MKHPLIQKTLSILSLATAALAVISFSILQPTEAMAGLGQCGGEGPTPINDERVTPRYSALNTAGSVLEYAVSESTSEVFYRTDNKELFRTTIGSTKTTKIADSTQPLSKVMHKKGAYLVTEPESYFWNLGKSLNWSATTLSADPVNHLFWESDSLYSYKEQTDVFGRPAFQFISYKAGNAYSTLTCGSIPANGWGYTMATGGAFPHVYFYTTSGTIGGNQLTLYRFDLRTCLMTTIGTYRASIPGNINWVHWFQGSNSVAVSTDHPTKNLLYDQGNGICHYFDLGGDEPLIANPKIPSIVVVRSTNQADVIHLQTGKKNTLNGSTGYYANVKWSDFYLTGDGKTLYVAPEVGGTRDLIAVKVKP